VNALLVVPRLPGTGFTGDRVRAAQHLSALRRAGFETTLVGGLPHRIPLPSIEGVKKIMPVPLHPWVMAKGIAAAGLRGDPLQTGLVAGDWKRAIRQAGDRFDLVVVVLARLWPHLEGAFGAAPVVLDYVDALGAAADDAMRRDPAVWWRLYWRLEAGRLRKLERRAARWTVLRIATTPLDAAELPAPIEAVPNGVSIGPEPPHVPRPPVVVFSGRLGYRPNAVAAENLARDIWPRVRRAVPEATLILGGADAPTRLLRWHGHGGVAVESPVADMPVFLRRARVVAAPVTLGTGTPNKVFEALEAGAAIVASPEVVARVGMADLPVRTAATAGEFADQLVTLLKDPDVASREGAAGRDWVVKHADRTLFTEELARLYGKVVAG
jgi:polysaccharide biosynthesis protein PslH